MSIPRIIALIIALIAGVCLGLIPVTQAGWLVAAIVYVATGWFVLWPRQ